MLSIHAVRSTDFVALAGMLIVCAGIPPLAGCVIVTIALSLYVVMLKTMGLSIATLLYVKYNTSGAANQNVVSVCAFIGVQSKKVKRKRITY